MTDRAIKRPDLDSQVNEDVWKAQLVGTKSQNDPDVRVVSRFLLGADEKGVLIEDDDIKERYAKAVIKIFARLDSAQRSQVYMMVFPNLYHTIHHAMTLFPRLPYSNGWHRRAFRNPDDRSFIDRGRFRWLAAIAESLNPYPYDIHWVVRWATDFRYLGRTIAILLAAAVESNDENGRAVLSALTSGTAVAESASPFGYHTIAALLTANNSEGWEFVEKLLLAAQREEGLRQVILEAVDESHPIAFARLLRVVLENGLVRFASVARAACLWFGFDLYSAWPKTAEYILELTLKYLDDPAAQTLALESAQPLETYLALWCMAFDNVGVALPAAIKLTSDADAERRLVAAWFLALCQLPAATQALANMIDDGDERVAAIALTHGARHISGMRKDYFDRLVLCMNSLPAKPKAVRLQPLPLRALTISRELAADSLASRPSGYSALELVPHCSKMSIGGRIRSLSLISKITPVSPEVREALINALQDGSPDVRAVCLKALEQWKLQEPEIPLLETLLNRKAGDIRRGCIKLLYSLPDDAAFAIARRLVATGKGGPYSAGLELLTLLYRDNRKKDECLQLARSLQKAASELSVVERNLFAAFDDRKSTEPSLMDSLGLAPQAARTQPEWPILRPVEFVNQATKEALASLDALVHKHAQTPVVPLGCDGNPCEEKLFGDVDDLYFTPDRPIAQQEGHFLLRDIWLNWFENRPASQRDTDGYDLARMTLHLAGLNHLTPAILKEPSKGSFPKLKYRELAESIVQWLILTIQPDSISFLLDCFETLCAQMPRDILKKQVELLKRKSGGESGDDPLWQVCSGSIQRCRQLLNFHFRCFPEKWTKDQIGRYFHLLRWVDEPCPGLERYPIEFPVVLKAFDLGLATRADVIDAMVGANWYRVTNHTYFHEFKELTRRKPDAKIKQYPPLAGIVDEVRRVAIGIELKRGEMPTVATPLVEAISFAGDLKTLIAILNSLDSATLARKAGRDRVQILSRLAQRTWPANSDTAEVFAQLMCRNGIQESQLVPLAFYAPQWAAHIEASLGWPGLEDAVYWIHAHAKDQNWSTESNLEEEWIGSVRLRTDISAEDLLDGAVDVEWFNNTYKKLGAKRWKVLYDAAKFASTGSGHARAKLFSAAMLDEVKEKELTARVRGTRNQDALRALGLIPIPTNKDRDTVLERRYQTVQEFLRSGKQFGRQRQASERRAVEIALQNLARSAGYRDPMRLGWAMEARFSADLRTGFASAPDKDYSVTLKITEKGFPELTVTKADKPLKSIPPAVKKKPAVAALIQRKNDLEKSVRRMIHGFEAAMCRGDGFSRQEVLDLLANPQARPLLEHILLINGSAMGFLAAEGKCLRKADGQIEPLSKVEPVRIAHPADLFASKDWSLWQHDCFTRQQVQPFKQVFREFYPLTQTEREAINQSRRYSGHQLNAGQALALLGARGWIVNPDVGIFKVYYDVGMVAWLSFQETFMTPAQVDGLTIDAVIFTRRSGGGIQPLADIPARLFSETMRDMDLLVSVAHRGDVDPEASASTVEMRGKLINETVLLLQLHNVTVEGRFAIIQGKLASYNVHLGSGIVHMQPGGALEIVAVHAQGRGRLFLPFADDDPKTAEVMSKILMLARDHDLKDPNVLAQIRR